MTESEIKSAYSDYLRTPDGMMALKHAIETKRNCDDKDLGNGSFENVKLENIPKKITDKMVLIEITPLLVNNNCHNNCAFMELFGYKSVLGYIVVACKCGKATAFELHSVNEKDGVYYDYTRSSVSLETKRWFYPFQYKKRPTKKGMIKEAVFVDVGCSCCSTNCYYKIDSSTKLLTNFKPFIKNEMFV